ncbi:MAG: neutral/alkaline non-lysosomal ceramidase N-terminal domain-containing protein [Pirellulaceae bacterium]
MLRHLLLLLALCFLTLEPCAAGTFRAGAATADITPAKGVLLDGPISKNGPVTGVHDRLHARALVLDDGETRVGIVICDACMIGRDVFDQARKLISNKSTINPGSILMAATHTHAAVRATHIGRGKLDDAYHQQLARGIAQAVLAAEKNLAPAQLAHGSFNRPDLIACRRFLCQPGTVDPNPFGIGGERIKSVSGRSTGVIKPAGPVDPQFSVLSLQHVDGTPLAVLGNFSVHYCGGYQRGLVSADYFGHYAAALESSLVTGKDHPAMVGIMSNGTSGNTGAIQRGGKKYEPFEWIKVSGRLLADETIKTIETMNHRSDITLQAVQAELTLGVRKPDTKRIAWAKDILSHPEATHPHRWATVYANETLHLSRYPDQKSIILQAIRLGDIAIAAAPCEVFAETGLAIKRRSPFPKTFSIELANGYGGYLPTPEQHKLGGYETWPARSSFLEVEAEPKIQQALEKLLKQLTTP